MQPGAMGDAEVNSAFYDMSFSLWLLLLWHALVLEWIPTCGLVSGVSCLSVFEFRNSFIVKVLAAVKNIPE